MTILAYMIEKHNPFYDVPEHSENRDRNGGLHRMQNSVWYMYGALLCQGQFDNASSTSFKIHNPDGNSKPKSYAYIIIVQFYYVLLPVIL